MNEINVPKELEVKSLIEIVDLARDANIARVKRGQDYIERLNRVKSILEKLPVEDTVFLREFFLKNSLFGISM